MGAYRITTDSAETDIDFVHAYLTRSYWSPGIPKVVVRRAVANSVCFNLFLDDRQIGFARLVTDRATFAYLADVFVLEEHQKNGLGKMLMDEVVRHPEVQELRRWMLATADADTLYAKYGFTPLANPPRFMERHDPDVYG